MASSTAYRVEEPDVASRSARRILLIEDNRSDVVLITHMLRDVCHEQIVFTDVPRLADAFYQLATTDFDIAILDLGLPDIDGPTAVAGLRTFAPNLPIIVHTGRRDPALRNEAMLCGANYFWVKGQEGSIFFKHLVQQALASRR